MAFFQTKHLRIHEVDDDVAVLVLSRAQSPLNILDAAMLDDVERALDAVAKAKRHRLLVIVSGKSANFCHGPPPAIVVNWKKEDFGSWAERGQQVCGKLADLTIPSLCVIDGTCFDAGLELALACDHRVVIDNGEVSLGLPELEWGMVPCWGATQRLPRLIGLDNSLQMLLAGRKIDARTAWEWNLADDLVDEAGENPPPFLLNAVKRDWTTFPLRTWRQRWLESNRPGRWFIFRGAERILRTRIPEEMWAPTWMLNILRAAYDAPLFDMGLGFEREAIYGITHHPALHHMLRLLNQRERLRAPVIRKSGDAEPGMLGIIGDGLAALSLLLHSVTKDYEVVLRIEDKTALGSTLIHAVQLLQTEMQSGDMTAEQYQKCVGSLHGTHTWNDFDKVELVIDTTDGSLVEKQAFYRELEQHVAATTLIVPTTSRHRLADLRQGLKSPQRMVGMRLIEPWNRGSLTEVTAEGATDARRLRDWAVTVGKCVLPTPDVIGGVVMRVWLPALNEAGLLIKEGVRIDRIDHALRRFGMTFGPCEWMDRLGVDHIAALMTAMQPTFAGRIAFETGFALMVKKGWLGNKSGAGFYQRGLLGQQAHRAVELIWRDSEGTPARPVPALSQSDALAWIQRRLVTLMVLEAMRCLNEGLVGDPDDLDCAMCLTGWATHRGGPLGHARDLGSEDLTARCNDLAQQYGPRFAPVDGLARFSQN